MVEWHWHAKTDLLGEKAPNHENQSITLLTEMNAVWDLRSSGILCSVEWQSVTDVSGQPIGPIFKGQWRWGPIGYPETSVKTVILNFVKSQTRADLIYTAAVARKQINAVCTKSYPKPVNTLCGQNAGILNVNALCIVHAGNHALYGITDQLKWNPSVTPKPRPRTPSEHIAIRHNNGHSTCATNCNES